MKVIVLFSGGLDSTTCLASAVDSYGSENVTALSITYGQKHDKESECAEKIAKHYGVDFIKYDVSTVFEGSSCTLLKGNDDIPEESYAEQLTKTDGKPVSTYVPFRNGLFLSVATSIAISRGCDKIIYGAHKDDAAGNAYPDCSVEFFSFMKKAVFTGSGGEVEIQAPYIEKTKADIVADGLRLNVPYEMTWSCYKGGTKACGKCGTCIDRLEAFKKNGATDPIEYEV